MIDEGGIGVSTTMRIIYLTFSRACPNRFTFASEGLNSESRGNPEVSRYEPVIRIGLTPSTDSMPDSMK